jgi:actin related protein 2/3 complex subunit 1A/1B
MAKFKGLDKRAQAGSSDSSIVSTHQNAITQIFPLAVAGGNVTKFVTTGVDGRLVIWDTKSLESSIAGLKF